MKQVLLFTLLFIGHISCRHNNNDTGTIKINTTNSNINSKLKLPFGTIAKLEVQPFDGDLLQTKEMQGTFLLRILSINNEKQEDTLLMTFEDETNSFAKDNFGFTKSINKETNVVLSDDATSKTKKMNVNKKYSIMAYETGQFSGIPKGYINYQPPRADLDFHFKNYLVIISNLTK